jgi:hypothetical protein
MKDNYSSIDKALNIESSVVEVERDVKNIDITSNETIDVQKDYEYTRGNLYSLIEKGQEVLNGIMEVAEESASPRAYEVAGQLIKSVADTTDKLLDLQKKLKDVNENVEVKGPTTVNNALFVGSTAELSKLLKSNKADG